MDKVAKNQVEICNDCIEYHIGRGNLGDGT